MEPPLPAPWANAALAAYFGDRACPFCDHRNPVGAKFCNDCGSPLKPCNQCGAVNHQAATNCYKCGAECPALFTTAEATPVLPAADPTPAWATPCDVGVAATVTQPLFAAGEWRGGWGLVAIATILIWGFGAIATILIAGAGEHNAPTAASAVPMAVESKPVEPETTVALQAPIPTTNLEAPERASTRQRLSTFDPQRSLGIAQSGHSKPAKTDTQRPVPLPATKRTSTHQRPVPVGATPPVAQTLAAAAVAAPVAETREARRPDPWGAMQVSLARCDGDLIARIVCDQRVRRRFCEGHWGEAPECASGVANDHGQ